MPVPKLPQRDCNHHSGTAAEPWPKVVDPPVAWEQQPGPEVQHFQVVVPEQLPEQGSASEQDSVPGVMVVAYFGHLLPGIQHRSL